MLLVASIPIAIEIVCTTTLALGSRQLSAYGAIVTRLQSIEEMAGMNMLCSDKTGARAGGLPLVLLPRLPAADCWQHCMYGAATAARSPGPASPATARLHRPQAR